MKIMRKVICMMIAIVLCLGLVAPTYASEAGFVPSITYKPIPTIVSVVDENGNEFAGVIRNEQGEIIDYVDHGCLLITPVAHIWDDEIVVSKDVEELLAFLYEALNSGEMKIPYEKHEADLDPANMVIRDLFDARWVCEEHRAMVEAEGVTLEITFDLGVVADAQIFVMTYDEAAKEWSPIVKTVNNGDGTVTCTFEHLCGVEFSMLTAPAAPAASTNAPAEDAQEPANLLPWIIALGLAVVAFVVVLVVSKNKKKAAA
jgi:hypothetical protein